MRIPLWLEMTATKVGISIITVACESCGTEFVYAAKREATGCSKSVLFLDNQGAAERAENEAAKALGRMLTEDVDLIPCAQCGIYQASMVEWIRSQPNGWALAMCFFAAVGAIISCIAVLNSLVIDGSKVTPSGRALLGLAAVSCAVLAIAFYPLAYRLARMRDPNAEPLAERLHCAGERTMLMTEVKRLGTDRLMRPLVEPRGGLRRWVTLAAAAVFMFAPGIFGAATLWSITREYANGHSSLNWPTAEAKLVVGRIAVVGTSESNGAKRETFAPEVQYSYDVGGKTFVGTRFGFGSYRTVHQHTLLVMLDRLKTHASFLVRYNPAKHAESVIVPGFKPGHLPFLAALSLAGIGFSAYMLRLLFISAAEEPIEATVVSRRL